MAILRLMAWGLSAYHENDLLAHGMRQTIGDEWTDAIFEGRFAESPVVVQEQGGVLRVPRVPDAIFPTGGASNAWALAPERSMTGFPILANDPHLGYTNPSVWCEVSLEAPGLHVAGVTMPGLPGVAIGRTPTFAWGFTASMVSQTMVYEEDLDAEGRSARDGDAWIPLTRRAEGIVVKGKGIERFTVRSTPRGPLFSDLSPEHTQPSVSLHWTGMEISHELDAFIALNRARSVADAVAARSLVATPPLNMAAADSSGNIATISLGRFPIREEPAGLLDPSAHPPLYRIRRIVDELESRRKHSIADTRALQLDVYSIHAAELAPVLVSLVEGDPDIPRWVIDELAAWDYRATIESRATLIFETFYRHWVRESLLARLPEAIVVKLSAMLSYGAAPMEFCDLLLRGDIPTWLSDDQRRALARRSLNAALAWIEERLGTDPQGWIWGTVHTVTFTHPIGQISGPHERFVNVGPFPIPGDRTTAWPSGVSPTTLFAITGGPSMRFVTDLRRPDLSWMTNTLGQNGWALSRHYRDQLNDLLSGRVHPIWSQRRGRAMTILPR